MTGYHPKVALYYQFTYAWRYLLNAFACGSVFQFIAGRKHSVHAIEFKRMSAGKINTTKEVNQRRVQSALKKLNRTRLEGISLGISLVTYKPVVIPDYYLNQILLVLGTTGAGKTVTLRQFARYAIKKGYPLIWVDGKPTEQNVNQIWHHAKEYHHEFFGFNCGNQAYYNPFCSESYTELKDKIITLKDHWESDYYRSIAEDYLQTTLEVLISLGKQVDLQILANCLDFSTLALLIRESKNCMLAEKIKPLQEYDRQSLTGLQAHLNTLINSELGKYLLPNTHSFTLKHVIENNATAYFALPALKFPSFAKVLGKLVINDIKSVIEPLDGSRPIFIIFDEFSVFAGEQVLNLVNMGRGKGVHAIFGTQGLADLKKVDIHFESQLLNCVNTIICHRLNDQVSAESVTKWIGTRESFDVTAVVDASLANANRGSLSLNKSFIVHPDEIKQGLKVGEAYLSSKVTNFNVQKILIRMS